MRRETESWIFIVVISKHLDTHSSIRSFEAWKQTERHNFHDILFKKHNKTENSTLVGQYLKGLIIISTKEGIWLDSKKN